MRIRHAAALLFSVALSATAGHAQTTAPSASSPAASQSAPAAPSGDANQAIATTHADAPQPAHGANSFTRAQATARLKRHGFQNIAGLAKDQAGVWRGTGTKDGSPVQVWVDYKGNVGQQ